ncbi:SE-domain-containing protein [Schizopora paradoxa]|uniref:Squalene monooxygenase n=1 Tax=Schizopora paradoxa TaxID=27342 RepID=A0A0H2SUE2_9AGAM|nr:SE-domain-containing protein [Schizopora paradoxa]
MTSPASSYDVLIVGAGVAGCAFAHALSTITSPSHTKPLRIALLERSLAKPDRIVGELLQPGGVIALRKLGMEDCLEDIGAVPVRGYCVVHEGKQVHIPYPGGHEGRSFHHGRFIMALREKAKKAENVDVIEATVNSLVNDEGSGRIVGVKATRKGGDTSTKETFLARLVIIADGCFSNFRSQVMGETAEKPSVKGYFIGSILKDVNLPIDKHGTVCLVKGSGPVLLYQIEEHDTRILIDVKDPLPSDLKGHILDKVIPGLPPALQEPARAAITSPTEKMRRMPNSFLPPVEQGGEQTKEGVILIGDSWNMRHPLTGGGMTVALNDVVILSDLLRSVRHLDDWEEVSHILHSWHWSRKPLGSTINILSVALYDLFGAEDSNLDVLRIGCFKYFERGGRCVQDPVSLLSGIAPSPLLLFLHFFAVAFYAIWVMFTHPRPVSPPLSRQPSPSASTTDSDSEDSYVQEKPVYARPGLEEYPWLFVKSIRVFWTACVVFGPPLWSELR